MSKSNKTTIISLGIVIATFLLALLFLKGESLGITKTDSELPYVKSLFSTDSVHTLDIVIKEDDFNSMLSNAIDKEYVNCNVVIDNNNVNNVAIRTKGNSSLSSVSNSDSNRYSFKIEFDHYEDGKTYMGLDKLVLNNIIQDNTYLKDYLSYQMMNYFDVDSPLSSFIWITVNGKDWGLYLAVEAIEDSFMSRTYGKDTGNLYKPDSMNMVGGREVKFNEEDLEKNEEGIRGNLDNNPDLKSEFENRLKEGDFIGPRGGMNRGASDVALLYSDDEFSSYANIFENAKTEITDRDKSRLIATLKQLSTGENLEEILDIDEVLRYFVVHNYLLNFDSYTGSMMHNYYLYEYDGRLSMIAWDYNLAFGAFSMGAGRDGDISISTAMVNYPIDSPVLGATLEDRPMLGQLLSNEEYLKKYHELFSQFILNYFESGIFEEEFDKALKLISPYVEKDPTAFVDYDDFIKASSQLKEFSLLRGESIQGQLSGEIPSTEEGQNMDSANLIDASHINLTEMGSNNFGGNRGVQKENFNFQIEEETIEGDKNENMENETAKLQKNVGFKNLNEVENPEINGEMQNNFLREDKFKVEEFKEEGEANLNEPEKGEEVPQAPGNFPGGDGTFPDDFQGFKGEVESQDYSNEIFLLLGSVLILIIGLIVAKKFKIHR
ncbi:CotH kinase family protein [Anaerosphaera multitolerans]|uniref:Spore coat protein CotH n=1 Tax=Anaerosphaera multitolerans TaxID=2487351 RepID=A0A437S9C0_9FIRM|nr:CotH kinase family protein [Anaerosphaera multitolerans]RVU55715.1 spore coat protein CotH [Anaerosphaera multitolerans]